MSTQRSSAASDTLKCPTCNRVHRAKTDAFGNRAGTRCDFDAREIFGVVAKCPICLEDECDEVVALPCGHVLCKDDYLKLGAFLESVHDRDRSLGGGVLLRVRRAGQQGVNGTYRRHHDEGNRYTSLGRHGGNDVEYCIEMRDVGGRKFWYLSCHTGNPSEPPVDFYKAKVNDSCPYPNDVRWEPATLSGTYPCPRVGVEAILTE